MTNKLKIAAVVGSLRANSYNLQLAKTMQERYEHLFDIEIADIGNLPLFNQDEENKPTEEVKAFKKLIAEANGVIFITPEYNWSIPGVLKNAIDWLSRVDKVFLGKPAMTAGVSPSLMGTIRAQLHLREILASPAMQAKLLQPAGNEIVIMSSQYKFDETTQRLTDEATLQHIDGVAGRFADWVRAHQ